MKMECQWCRLWWRYVVNAFCNNHRIVPLLIALWCFRWLYLPISGQWMTRLPVAGWPHSSHTLRTQKACCEDDAIHWAWEKFKFAVRRWLWFSTTGPHVLLQLKKVCIMLHSVRYTSICVLFGQSCQYLRVKWDVVDVSYCSYAMQNCILNLLKLWTWTFPSELVRIWKFV